MHLHRSNQTRLLRRLAADRCKYCDTPIEWFERYDSLRIPLSPEFPAGPVPQRMQWHLAKGVAYPGGILSPGTAVSRTRRSARPLSIPISPKSCRCGGPPGRADARTYRPR
ncbi:DUF6083 domain-containing protein [Streptomyces hydrogenans]|uniref:DUF6083 domain-containing protein n=1 Tax=Streptomyces hydrogenans TaxID=1873719 RepID=UPI001CFDAE2B